MYLLKRLRLRRLLPPGPSSGLFGNRSQIPANEPWKAFAAWSKKFGSVFSFYFGWTPVIGTYTYAYELLDKRGEIYSSRPQSIMGQLILSGDMRGLTMQYGERWKRWRKLQHIGMGGKAAQAYRQFQSFETCVLLRELMQDANAYGLHFRRQNLRFATSVAFAVSYGNRIRSVDEQVVVKNAKAMIGEVPGKYLVDSWPIFLWLPKPLQWFRWEMEKRKTLDIELYVGCLRNVKQNMALGTAKECMSARMLALDSVNDSEGADEVEMAYAASAPFAAGVGTVSASLEVFLLAMLHNPACAKKAQVELDTVVGRARMPDFADEPILPYVRALVKEVMRWRPIAPTGVPHAVTQDDYYNGFIIPKGATVYANICAICQDPGLFPDAEVFRPERFLEPTNKQLTDFDIPFGFGRRICPGQHVAAQSLFVVIARMLWAFNIDSEAGDKSVLPDASAFVGGLVRRPQPFRLSLIARSEDARKLINAAAIDAETELEAWN
ncbi:cytochrome P450 [Phellopilus nigrolimitatus]|nr:cytochrome P450 [Phellopilus nigrolimitatus]